MPKLLASVKTGWCLGKFANLARAEAETKLPGALRVVRKLHDYLLTGAATGILGLLGAGAAMNVGHPSRGKRFLQVFLAVVLWPSLG